MSKKIRNVIMLIMICLVTVIFSGAEYCKADTTSTEVKVTSVNDISLYNKYTPEYASFSEVTCSFIATNETQSYSRMCHFTIKKPSIVKININNYDVNTRKTSNSTTTISKQTLKFNVYREAGKVNLVKNLGSVGDNFYSSCMYLEAGTYSIDACCDGISSGSFVCGSYKIGVIAQESLSDEVNRKTYFENANSFKMSMDKNSNITGSMSTFISDINVESWYTFYVPKEMRVDLMFYRYSGEGTLSVNLLDSNKVLVASSEIFSSYSESNINKYLEKGRYYVKISNNTTKAGESGVGGDVSCDITGTVYKFTCTEDVDEDIKVNTNVTIDIDANFEVYSSILVLKSSINVSNANKYSSRVWKKAKYSGTDSIEVAENGSYYVLVKDKEGNVVYDSVKISNIDKKAPSAPKISKAVKNGTVIKGTAEKGSKVKIIWTYTKSDGSKITKKYTTVADSKTGEFSVKVKKMVAGVSISITATDSAGNVSNSKERTFTQDANTSNSSTNNSSSNNSGGGIRL